MTLLLLLLLLGLWVPAYADASTLETRTWHFDEDRPEQLPPKFAMGTFFDGRPAGDWKVITTPKALSPPNVFAQLREKGAEHHYNVVLIDDTNTADLDLSVSFLPISGKADMGGGLIWRAKDDRNYYLTRGMIASKTEIIPTFISTQAQNLPALALAATILITTASTIALTSFKYFTRVDP